MKKKLISLVLLAGMLLGAFTGCSSQTEEKTATEKAAEKTKTGTITLTAITGDSTTPEAIAAVQKALNRLTKSNFKTQVILQMKTEDEYLDFIEEQVAQLKEEERLAEEEAARLKAEKKAKKEAEKIANAKNKKSRSKWTTTTTAETESTEEVTQGMTQDEYGRDILNYPELEGVNLDIIFITGIDMYNDFVEKEYLASLNDELSNNSKVLNKYIYPTVLSAGKTGKTTYAIGMNRMMGEYTYMLIDKELAAKYKLNTENVKKLTDCEEFLDSVKQNESGYIPLNEAPEINYVDYCTSDRSILGTVFSANYVHSSSSLPKNLCLENLYVEHYTLRDKLNKGGYVSQGEKYAIQFVKGNIDAPELNNWEEKYDVIVYEAPIARNDVLYEGMFAVSAYSDEIKRSMEVITLLNTDAEAHNIYAFGVEGENYELNADGTVHMLNDDWNMNFFHTGNTFIGAVPETLPANYAEIGKLQNLETVESPFFKWYYPVKTIPATEEKRGVEGNEEYQAAFDKVAPGFLKGFDAAADKEAYGIETFPEATIDKESGDVIDYGMDKAIYDMLDKDNDLGYVGSYIEFHSDIYGS